MRKKKAGEKNLVHCFYVEDAVKHGKDKAVLLYNFRFWLNHELARMDAKVDDNSKIQKLGDRWYVWTYNPSRVYAELFPYYTERSIARWLRELEDDGVLISGCFNKLRYDKTKWYTMPEYEVTGAINALKPPVFSICQIGESNSQNGEPIPDVNTDITADYKKHTELRSSESLKVAEPAGEYKTPTFHNNYLIGYFQGKRRSVGLTDQHRTVGEKDLKVLNSLIEQDGVEGVMDRIDTYFDDVVGDSDGQIQHFLNDEVQHLINLKMR